MTQQRVLDPFKPRSTLELEVGQIAARWAADLMRMEDDLIRRTMKQTGHTLNWVSAHFTVAEKHDIHYDHNGNLVFSGEVWLEHREP